MLRGATIGLSYPRGILIILHELPLGGVTCLGALILAMTLATLCWRGGMHVVVASSKVSEWVWTRWAAN